MKRQFINKIFSNIPIIQTDRIKLRKMLVDDAANMYEYAKNPEVTKHLTWQPHFDIYYTTEYLRYIGHRYNCGEFYDWAIEHKEDGKMIGTCGFTRFDYPHNIGEIGYVINPQYSGMGIATEAVAQVIKFGFEVLELNRIECKYMEDNVASRRVMEKNNMTFEGVRREAMLVKNEYRNIGVCSILVDDFKAHV